MESKNITLTTCSIFLPFLFIFWFILQTSDTFQLKHNHIASSQQGSIDGLLASGFNRESCLSRYESSTYRKTPSNFKPSSHLLSRLRRYEDLHRRCGPNTHLYNKTIELITGRQSDSTGLECNYVVWLPFSGLGNRMLTLSSAFLYALLTNRVLLVDAANEMTNLFCEPFLQTSWLLPNNFPLLDQITKIEETPPQYYGQMMKNGIIGYSNNSVPSFLYLNLAHDYDDHDKLFFCDQDQDFLSKVPWLVLRSNNYFIPSLFLIPSFQNELERLFPEKEAVFHHLGRYLFHPTNEVWGLITRYYEAYLAKADKKIGIQIRVLESGDGEIEPYQHVIEQVLACTWKEEILPETNYEMKPAISFPKRKKHKAVLVTSLNSGYYEKMKDLYWENPTVNGEVMEFYQASHEEFQHSENQKHNSKAWAEIYLLSLTDELVTSSWSTFGYVAQGLGGLRPWILTMPVNKTVPEPACKRAMSMEPCFHAPPHPKFNCRRRRKEEGIDEEEIVSHVRQCEDRSWGLKLFD
ncbi:galactoside 2-alpha-L-fucosyltransferase-like [Impatiens glandulifera]|uniref:galactoside 2-alpha-L-fucosyltransferase-like n=1 Tax=Impatiens glandulifera TaxID=253017 RepID=UPI001FB0AACC|nr:galactoside 2-alpha-L-fucosyltransferase-like [Impatiens glandulifera]